LTSAVSSSSQTALTGNFTNSTGGAGTFLLQFYDNVSPNLSGYGEGRLFLGSTNITTSSGGVALFTVTLQTNVPVGSFIAATATDSNNSTWEFGPDIPVTASVALLPVTIVSGLTANNKVYDRTTTATLSSNNVLLSGVLAGDTVNLETNGYVANFAGPAVGNAIAVTVSGLTLGGSNAAKYTLSQPALSANITAAPVTIASGLTANNKVYDRTTAATLSSNNVVLSGVVAGDTVVLNTNGYVANFASPAVGNAVAVRVSGLSLSGAGAANYSLTQPSLAANITAAPVTIASGLTANNKVYDRTTTATLSSNNVVLSGVVAGDTVMLNTNGYVANFASPAVSNAVAVRVSGLSLSGAGAANYSLTQPSLAANITAAPVTIVSGLTANNKVYDGTTTATLSSNNVVLSGVVAGDTVILDTNGYVANFASPAVGNAIMVTVSGLTLSGAGAANYTLVEPTLMANITGIAGPQLQILASLPNIVVSWSTNAGSFSVQQTTNLVAPVTWSNLTNPIVVNGSNNTVIIVPSGSVGFYRLVSQ
jgi:hypothetical protein